MTRHSQADDVQERGRRKDAEPGAGPWPVGALGRSGTMGRLEAGGRTRVRALKGHAAHGKGDCDGGDRQQREAEPFIEPIRQHVLADKGEGHAE